MDMLDEIHDDAPPADTAGAASDGPRMAATPDPALSGQESAALREVAAPAEAGVPGNVTPWPEAAPPETGRGGDAALREVAAPAEAAAGSVTPWPEAAPPETGRGGDAPDDALPPPPTHAEWRQLSAEVRRLASQIAHGRA